MSTYVVALDQYGSPFVWGTGGSAGNTSEHPSSNAYANHRSSNRMDIKPQILEALSLDRVHGLDKGLTGSLSNSLGNAGGYGVVIDVACGLGHALFLLSCGTVLAWGNGGNGRLGLQDMHDRAEATFLTALDHEHITQVQCGASHSLAVTKCGKLYCWGKNSQGQLGIGTLEDETVPTLVASLCTGKDSVIVKQVAAGWEHTVILTSTGLLYACGCGYKDNRRGIVPPVLGLGHNEGKSTPELLSSLLVNVPPSQSAVTPNEADGVNAADDLSVPAAANDVKIDKSMEIDLLSENKVNSSVDDENNIRIKKISCGWDHCLALDTKGRTFSWGSGQNGKLGHGNEENFAIPCIIPSLENICIDLISAGCEHSCAVSVDGHAYSWGHGDGGRLGLGDNNPRLLPTLIKSLISMRVK